MWRYVASNRLIIVSKDADFHQRSFLYGHPPKVVWIRKGNCATQEIEALLRSRCTELVSFDGDDKAALLVLS